MRKQDPNGDYGRAARQRQLLAAVAQKLNSASTVFKIKDLTTVVGKYIKTDIPISDGLALYNKLSGFDPSTIQTLKLEGEDKKIGGIYYFLPDPIGVETVRNEIEKELGKKQKLQQIQIQKPIHQILTQILTLTKKQRKKQTRTKHQLSRPFHKCSCRVDYEKSGITKRANSYTIWLFLFTY